VQERKKGTRKGKQTKRKEMMNRRNKQHSGKNEENFKNII
jgi:hypothetical protein